jgi:hypothetical protein
MWLDVLSTEEFENVVRQQNRSEVMYRIHYLQVHKLHQPMGIALWFVKVDSRFHTPE